MSRVAVVTDSAAALPPDVAARLGVHVVPLWLLIGGERHRDGDLPLEAVVARFSEPISTSAPSPGEYAEVMAQLRGDGPVVALTVSERMSSSFEAAVLAAKLVAGDAARVVDAAWRTGAASSSVALGPGADGAPAAEVVVVDTDTAAGAQGLVVQAAAEAAGQGADLATVLAVIERVVDRVRLVATVADLERLAASGRVPEAARRIGDRLGVQPLFEFRHGRARPLRPAFSTAAARDRILRRCVADAPPPGPRPGRLHATVLHALDPEAAADLRRRVEALDPASCDTGPFSPVMVVHTGRGLAGLAWWWEA